MADGKTIPGEADIEKFKTGRVFIHRTATGDKRGWYICEPAGMFHLYRDGKIRCGANGPSAFWKTEKDATEYFLKWKAGNDKPNTCSLLQGEMK